MGGTRTSTEVEVEKEFDAAENESVTDRRILFSKAISTSKVIEAKPNAEEERKKVTHSMYDFDK